MEPARLRALLYLVLPLAAGLFLRLRLLPVLFGVDGDSIVYGSIAKNLLQHGRFALSLPNGEIYSTLIRLPGYPFFLALCFRLFGMENYFAAALVQIVLDLAACLLIADTVRRLVPPSIRRGAALSSLWLACLCPFTASYTSVPLAESPTIFALALALWAVACFVGRPGWSSALCFTFAATCAALLRPDGVLVAVALAPALLIALKPGKGSAGISLAKLSCMAFVCLLLALAPFALWTARNWRVFQVFQPLAPRLAIDPGESPNLGWERWVKTWCLDFTSTYDIYWNVPGDKFDFSKLPARAFDSPAQYTETAALVAEYNTSEMRLTPALDAGFARLASQRTAAHPLRTHLWLPLGRLADMWLRPRVENINVDMDWWVYARHHAETRFSYEYAALNLVYLLLGFAGLCLSFGRFGDSVWRRVRWALAAYILLRSGLLLTVGAPETRYTIECFPLLFAAGGVALWSLLRRAITLRS